MGTREARLGLALKGHGAGVWGSRPHVTATLTSFPYFFAQSRARHAGRTRRHGHHVDTASPVALGSRRHGSHVDMQVGHAVPTGMRVGTVRVIPRQPVRPCEWFPCECSTCVACTAFLGGCAALRELAIAAGAAGLNLSNKHFRT